MSDDEIRRLQEEFEAVVSERFFERVFNALDWGDTCTLSYKVEKFREQFLKFTTDYP
jgi:hypothetical protein